MSDLSFLNADRSNAAAVWRLYDLARWSHLAVTAFITLSGFCLMLRVVRDEQNTEAWQFYLRRARRIFPPYYAALALAVGVAVLTRSFHPPAAWRDLVGHLLILHDVFFRAYPWYQFAFNAPMWSIAVEEHIYWFFPLLVLLWRQAGVRFTLLTSLAVAYGLWYLAQDTPYAGMTLQYYGLFVVGMMGAAITYSDDRFCIKARSFAWGRITAAGFAGVLLLCAVLGWTNYNTYQSLVDLPFSLAFCALLVALSLSHLRPVRRLLCWPPLVLVGTFSYSLYLVHSPLILILRAGLHHVNAAFMQTTGGFVLSLFIAPLIIATAYLFFRLFERPFLLNPQMSAVKTRAAARDAVHQRWL